MRTRSRTAGVTLLELLIVVAIVSVLATVAYWGYAGVIPKFRLDAATRDASTALALARAEAISKNRRMIVEFQATRYLVGNDANTNGTLETSEVTRTVEYGRGVTYFRPTTDPLPAGDLVIFDSRGIANNITVGGQSIGLTNGTVVRSIMVRYIGMVRTN